MTIPNPALAARIHGRCIEDGDCLIWQGCAVKGKSPQMRINGTTLSVRRLLWEALHGPVPDGKQVARTCECVLCVRHIAPETYGKVARRAAAAGGQVSPARRAKISATKTAAAGKLTPAIIADIRSSAESGAQKAREYGISKSLACAIRRGAKHKDHSSPFAGLGARV